MQVTIYADGGSRGNPGIAGSGTAVFGSDGTLLTEIVEYVGKATNNVAEYHALINGLTAAADLGADSVEVFMDSKLVVEQMSGRWKIKHKDMLALAQQAQALIARFGSFSISWVPREKNKHADRLSNVAMDAGAAGAPPGIIGASPEPGATPLRIYLVRTGAATDALTRALHSIELAAVIASPLSHTQNTARTIAADHRLAVHTEPLITARSTADGEDMASVDRRVKKALTKMMTAWMGRTIVWVSHASPLTAALRHAARAPLSTTEHLCVEPGSISCIEFYPDGHSLLRSCNCAL
ncbi:MAG: reverse transcriptase-like protein [Corynebacterium sp.]|nr:reverse transcriptase-like protein [Corynebacterium sp.]